MARLIFPHSIKNGPEAAHSKKKVMTFKVAIASGKGGTGKTTVATNLAQLAAARGLRVAYVDCDVEAPNGHLFLRPEIHRD